jgi:hypothetical protein
MNIFPEDRTEAILAKYLDNDFKVFPMARASQPVYAIEAVGRTHSVQYPPDFSTHVCGRFPGIYVEVKEEIWPRPKAFDVGPFWSFLYALHTFTPDPSSEPWMRLDDAAARFQKDTGFVAAPVLRVVGDADVYCVDADGKLVQFRHETNELEAVGLSFWGLFEREVEELRKRKDMKKAPS